MTEYEDLFDSLFFAISDSIALYKLEFNPSGQASDYRFVNVNPAFESQTGLQRANIVGQLASQVYGVKEAPYLERFSEVAITGEPTQFDDHFEALNKPLVISVLPQSANQFLTLFSNTSVNQQTLAALEETQQELMEAQRISHTGNWRLDLATNAQVWSEELYLMLGLDPSQSPPEYPETKLFTEESWAQLSDSIAQTSETGAAYELELEMIRADGSHGWMLSRGEAVRDESGSIVSIRGVAADITDRKKAELELIDEKAFVDKLINIQADTFFVFDPATGIPYRWNESLSIVSGYSHEEIASMKAPMDFFDEEDIRRANQTVDQTFSEGTGGVELNLVTKQGKRIPFEYKVRPIRDNQGATLLISLGRDVTERKRAEEKFRSHEAELRRIAHYDTLTSIPNRLLLSDRMNQAIARASRDKNMMAVCYLDLDGFKPINDLHGHNCGDQVLIVIANRIKKVLRETDTVARLGGDEFVILIQNLQQSDECVVTIERLLDCIAQPIVIDRATCKVTASIGVSLYPLEDEDPDTLMRHADHAMYVAKQQGKNCFHVYDPAREQESRECHLFLESIAHGLKHNQFELFYQPKINLKTKQLIGAEALIRWQHPDRGLLSPAEFLFKIGNTKLDIDLGEWVVATALAQLNTWHQAGLDIEVSINITGFHIESSNFVALLKHQLSLYPNIQSSQLQIEVLETIALSDIEFVRGVIESCKSMGVGFALDDFGTGYSSLTYLSRLPVDVLKIDQSFIRDMLIDKGDMSIVQGIIALAKTFNRKTVAEGIETKEHYQALLDMNCELGQGYYIARPMPAPELLEWEVSSEIKGLGSI